MLCGHRRGRQGGCHWSSRGIRVRYQCPVHFHFNVSFISIPSLSDEKVSVVFQMCWRLITGNEEAEEVRGRDK